MSRWPRGEAQIEQLIANKQLQRVIGGQANGAHLLQKASRTLETAGEIAGRDPDSAYVLAYDAARYSGTAILAHQGLRPTTPTLWSFSSRPHPSLTSPEQGRPRHEPLAPR